MILTPVFAVKAKSMSSSAFFIDAAANTVRLLSAADAGEEGDPNRIATAKKNPASQGMGALRACSRRPAAREVRHWSTWNATGGSADPLSPATYGRSRVRMHKP